MGKIVNGIFKTNYTVPTGKYNITASVDNQKLSTNLNYNPNVNSDVPDEIYLDIAKLTSHPDEDKTTKIVGIVCGVIAFLIIFIFVLLPWIASVVAAAAISNSMEIALSAVAIDSATISQLWSSISSMGVM